MLEFSPKEEKLGPDILSYLAENGIRAAMDAVHGIWYVLKEDELINLLLTIASTYFPILWKQMGRNLCWNCLLPVPLDMALNFTCKRDKL